jgi:dTDP-4-dehydrorhamnose reductase
LSPKTRILQIATDCVFSGNSDTPYTEKSDHDAIDVYGKTKSLGEVQSKNINHLRCSIIGPEHYRSSFLLEWFLSQKKKSEISGYTNHFWNGITTYHFARICEGIINSNMELPHLQHVLPSDKVTKYDLLNMFSKYYNRNDIEIKPSESEYKVNRILATVNPSANAKIWESAGYSNPPTIEKMIEELSSI